MIKLTNELEPYEISEALEKCNEDDAVAVINHLKGNVGSYFYEYLLGNYSINSIRFLEACLKKLTSDDFKRDPIDDQIKYICYIYDKVFKNQYTPINDEEENIIFYRFLPAVNILTNDNNALNLSPSLKQWKETQPTISKTSKFITRNKLTRAEVIDEFIELKLFGILKVWPNYFSKTEIPLVLTRCNEEEAVEIVNNLPDNFIGERYIREYLEGKYSYNPALLKAFLAKCAARQPGAGIGSTFMREMFAMITQYKRMTNMNSEEAEGAIN